MYTQALNTSDAEAGGIEDAARAQAFQARIDADERIEPNDWMPVAYRKTLTRQISTVASSIRMEVKPDSRAMALVAQSLISTTKVFGRKTSYG